MCFFLSYTKSFNHADPCRERVTTSNILKPPLSLPYHSSFAGYYLGFGYFSPNTPVLKPWILPLRWQMYLLVCVALPLCATILASYWSRNKWGNHHLAKTLQVSPILNNKIVSKSSVSRVLSSCSFEFLIN